MRGACLWRSSSGSCSSSRCCRLSRRTRCGADARESHACSCEAAVEAARARAYTRHVSERILVGGERIGGYVVERLIGEGGMGHVYSARHEFMGVSVALKLLRREFRGRPELVDKMRAEAQLLRKLDHPHLVRVSDAGVTSDGSVWMAMDLLAGENLRATLAREGRLSLARVVTYALQAAGGLCAAHAQGVIHRDFEPENIFITTNGDVKLLDFGTAKFRLQANTAIERFTTLAYAPPEQLSGEPLDGRADVYALAIVLHEALTGAHFLRRPDGSFPNLAEVAMLQFSTSHASTRCPPRRPRSWGARRKSAQPSATRACRSSRARSASCTLPLVRCRTATLPPNSPWHARVAQLAPAARRARIHDARACARRGRDVVRRNGRLRDATRRARSCRFGRPRGCGDARGAPAPSKRRRPRRAPRRVRPRAARRLRRARPRAPARAPRPRPWRATQRRARAHHRPAGERSGPPNANASRAQPLRPPVAPTAASAKPAFKRF